VFLARKDGHAAWLNGPARAALRVAPDRKVVEEAAFDVARSRLPARTEGERIDALRPHLRALTAANVMTIDDMVEPWAPEIYARLRDGSELPVSIGLWLPDAVTEQEAAAVRRAFPPAERTIATRGIKIFLDGSLGARTAALSRPYADDPSNSGALRMDERELETRVFAWASGGWPVAIHAIGDRAVTVALNALERAPRAAWGAHRIEHAQVVRRADVPRFERAGIVASVQPGHWGDDRRFLAGRLGDRPEVVAHPLRCLALSGATLVFGSDWPVSEFAPAAVLSAATDPERGAEALDAAEATAWYTSAPR
jgi:predicted amidohydrolase YtcJ